MVDWDHLKLIKTDHFLERITKRNISLNEITHMFNQPKLIFRRKSFPEMRYLIIGEADGRILEIILEHKEKNIFFLITAYEASDQHKRFYRQKMK